MRLHLVGVLLAVFACADAGPTAPVLLDGSYLGSSPAYAEVRLTFVDQSEALTGRLFLRNSSGRQVFVTVQGTKLPTGELRIELSDAGQPASTIVPTPQP